MLIEDDVKLDFDNVLIRPKRSTCTYVGAPTLKQLSKCTTFIKVTKQYNEMFK